MSNRTRLLSVISYITWIGWLIAFILWDRKDEITHQHINQALNLNLIGILISVGYRIGGIIQWACGVIALLTLVLTFMGIIRAVQMSDRPLPIVGNMRIL